MTTIKEIITWSNSKGNRVVARQVDTSTDIIAPRNITEADRNHISFIGTKLASQAMAILKSTKCRIIILEEELLKIIPEGRLPEDIAFVIARNPKKEIIEYCTVFLGFQKPIVRSEIHPTACISKNATVGKNVRIKAFVFVDDHVTIGDNCFIGANTVINNNTVIGNNVKIGSGTVIGGIGFGYSKNDDREEYELFPHYGGVIIKDNVHIGNNTCVDKGSLSDTVIEEGVKIDNLVHIAHNVKIGKNSLVIACSMVAGSVVTGKNCWIAPCACIRNGIELGNNVTVGLASTVTKTSPDGQTVMGIPAMAMEDFVILRNQQKQSIDRYKKSEEEK